MSVDYNLYKKSNDIYQNYKLSFSVGNYLEIELSKENLHNQKTDCCLDSSTKIKMKGKKLVDLPFIVDDVKKFNKVMRLYELAILNLRACKSKKQRINSKASIFTELVEQDIKDMEPENIKNFTNKTLMFGNKLYNKETQELFFKQCQTQAIKELYVNTKTVDKRTIKYMSKDEFLKAVPKLIEERNKRVEEENEYIKDVKEIAKNL